MLFIASFFYNTVDIVEKITKRKIRPTFITIDPERDDTETVNDYCLEFHPRLLGLTGTRDQIQKITRLFRVYFSRTNDSEDDYLIDHSIISYLVDPEGNFVDYFGKSLSKDEMQTKMGKTIDAWETEKWWDRMTPSFMRDDAGGSLVRAAAAARLGGGWAS